MGLGGAVLAGLGILIATLVANGRWPNVWAAMLGTSASGSSATGAPPIGSNVYGPTAVSGATNLPPQYTP